MDLGVVLVGGNQRSKLELALGLQTSALIVTAGPYDAVHQPSDAVVPENAVYADTKGTTKAVNAKYELMERGGYIPTGNKFDPVVMDAKSRLELLAARNALRFAQSERAETYAGDTYGHAVELMSRTDIIAPEKHSPKEDLIAISRDAVQKAEDARSIAAKIFGEGQLASERQAAADAPESVEPPTCLAWIGTICPAPLEFRIDETISSGAVLRAAWTCAGGGVDEQNFELIFHQRSCVA